MLLRRLRRFAKIIILIGAGRWLSFKAEQKAHSNAMQLKRQRRRCANRPAKRGIFFAGNRLSAIVVLVGVVSVLPCSAHHGGLGIEGDLVEWALKVDQWQAEVLARGYRIKFLSYPRQPLRASRTRLVFEIQSALTGQYISGLKADLIMRSPDGTSRTLPLPETSGVTAYYETAVSFAETGLYSITFQSEVAGGKLQGTFRKTVRASVLSGDWTIWLGYLVVTLAGAVTWVGLLLSIQRRFRVGAG